MSLKLVPFNPTWVTHDKLDVHAIYRRPRFVQDEFGDYQREYDPATGLPTWDLTGPLPVRAHNKWSAKGFVYVTLADRVSLYEAGRHNTLPPGTRASDYDQHQVGGPWNYRRWLQGADDEAKADLAELTEDVYAFGSAAVEQIRKRNDPAFELPKQLRGIAAGTARVEAKPEGTAKRGAGVA